jgi:energy-coupling factor transporter ATP-binding protein EcfA2
MNLLNSKITILIGHYGSGKTTLAVNLAYHANQESRGSVALADIDVNNPYFRSRDWLEKFAEYGIDLIIPDQEIAYSEMPFLPAQIYSFLQKDKKLILDVGGHGVGTTVLSSLARTIQKLDYELWFIVNTFRPGSETKEEIIEMYNQLQSISRLSITGVINNSNLADSTDLTDVVDSEKIVKSAAEELCVPFLGNCVEVNLLDDDNGKINSPIIPIQRLEKLKW